MNSKRKNSNNKTKLLVLLVLLVITIGYALVSSNISFSGLFGVKAAKWDIHFDNVSDSESTVTPVKAAEIDENDDKLINFSVNLDKPLDKYSFTADVVNAGTINGIVEEIKLGGLENNPYADYIDFKATVLKSGDVIVAGSQKMVCVTVEFKNVDNLPESYENNTFNLSVSIKVKKTDVKDLPTTASTLDDSISSTEFQGVENIVITTNGIPRGAEVVTGFISKAFMLGVGADNTYIDVTEEKDGSIVLWKEGTTAYIGAVKPGYKVRAPKNCLALFSGFWVDYIDVTYLDVSGVTNMESMFESSINGRIPDEYLLQDSEDEEEETIATSIDTSDKKMGIYGMETWDTSNVTNMKSMFYNAFRYIYDSSFIDSISNWDVGNVTSMDGMFQGAFAHAENVNLKLNNWNTSKVTDMSYMFSEIGSFDAKEINLEISEWDVSNVTDMYAMFQSIGRSGERYDHVCDHGIRVRGDYTITMDLSKWNTGKVTNMDYMFSGIGYIGNDLSMGNISNWNTSSVTSMYEMFAFTTLDPNAPIDLSSWNVSNVTNHNFFDNGNNGGVIQPNWVN